MSLPASRNTREHSDKFFDEIEEFLYEYEIPNKSPLIVKRGRLYSDSDLLDVLNSDNTEKNTLDMSVQNQKPLTCSVLPKKRKPPELHEETIVKKKPVAPGKNYKGSKMKLCKARIYKYVETKFFECRRLMLSRKKKIERVSHHVENRHKAKVKFLTCKCDSVTVRNIVVKKEIIDLTEDAHFFYATLKFAKEICVEEIIVKPLDITPNKAKMVDVEDHLNKISIFIPDIRFDINDACIDLTEIDDTDESNVLVASEKEFANKIVPILYKCHKIYEVNKKMEAALCEMRECLPMQEAKEDYMYPFKLFSQHLQLLGYDLVRACSRIWVKNLNLTRFIEILAAKLEVFLKVSLKPHVVHFYLNVLLNQPVDTCKSRLLKDILRELHNYGASLKVKEERNYESVEVFTEEQLIKLRSQIEKYVEIAIRQEELMAVLNQTSETCLSAVTKEVKKEMLNLQEGLEYLKRVKVENEVVYVLDED